MLLHTTSARVVLAFLLLSVQVYALNDSTTIYRMYARRQGSASFQVLRLYSDHTYDYCQYTRKKINRDTGTYVMRRSKLQLQSAMKKNAFNPYLRKTIFVSEVGLHRKRIDAIFKKSPMIKPEPDTEKYADWHYNPAIKSTPPQATTVAVNDNREPETPVNTPVTPVSTTTKPASTYKPVAYKPVLPEVRVTPTEPGAFAKNYYIAVCSTYATGYDKVLENAYCGPDCYYSVIDGKLVPWNKDTAVSGLFGSIETVIHESVHHFNGREYLVVPGLAITVTRNKTYHSCAVKAIAPKDAASKIFRYETYIGDSSRVSANLSGIFGLLDEFSAYSHGVRFSMKAAEGAMAKRDTSLARAFLSQATSTSEAYYEFKLFIGWYLHYAKTSEPDVYKETMANKNLRVAYTLLEQEFAATNKHILQLAKMTGNSWGFGDLEKEGGSYMAPLLKAEQPYLDAFKINGVTKENYKSFLAAE